MPARNLVKQYTPDGYYHVYSRGVNKALVFKTEKDYAVFLGLLKRYLSPTASAKPDRHKYPTYYDKIELIAYALMPNHFHLMLHQLDDERALASFMRSIMTSYSMYFNKTYERVGPVFQSSYKAKLITNDKYLHHISRYIHLNPDNWRQSDKTSLGYFTNQRHSDWVRPHKVIEMFKAQYGDNYIDFVASYESRKDELDDTEWDLV
jgi:putative transposase